MEKNIPNKQYFNTQKLSATWPVFYTKKTGSTNQDALKSARQGAEHLTCFIAEEQTEGRGRRGRSWVTFPYKSIACSVIIREAGDILPLLVSLAVAKAIDKTTGVEVGIKWPNDLLVDGKKLAGILVESFQEAGKNIYIVGIGLNVNKPENAPEVPLITLQDVTGKVWAREEILESILCELNQTLKLYAECGWQALEQEYAERCITLGKEVVWQNGAHTLTGIAEKIEADGTLRLIVDNKQHLIRTGEIVAQGNENR